MIGNFAGTTEILSFCYNWKNKFKFNSDEEKKLTILSVNSLNSHLQAKDGSQTPFTYINLDGKLIVNLQEFYHNPLVRDDITISKNKYNCIDNGTNIDEENSKFFNIPICKNNDAIFSIIYDGIEQNNYFYVTGYPAKHIFKIDAKSPKYNNIMISCYEMKNNNLVSCEE